MLLEYILYLKKVNIFEFFIQIILLYNLVQLFKQVNFFFTLAYFLNFVIFVGFSMIIYDLDLGAIILWIIYGGVIIIFFLYAIMWIDALKVNIFFFDFRIFQYGFFIFYLLFFYLYSVVDFESFLYFEYNYLFINYYEILNFDIYEELEMLGNSFFFSQFFSSS